MTESMTNVNPLRTQLFQQSMWKAGALNHNVAAPVFKAPPSMTSEEPLGPDRKPRPQRQWRKQNCARSGSYAGIGMPMDRPGGSTLLSAGSSDCAPLREYISPDDCPKCRPGNKTLRIRSGMTNARVIGNPGEASTQIDNKYSTTTAELLRRRCQTYAQRIPGQPKAGVDYTQPPSNSPDGSQVRLASECGTDSCVNVPIIYKPNNTQFATQGPVDSSSRIARLKYNTIQKNAKSFATAYGAAAANAGRYSANGNAPYFIKSKVNVCMPSLYHVNGNKNLNCSS
jgi:hypothetical protein